VVGMAVMSVLMVALGSAVMLASKALPDEQRLDRNLTSSQVANRIAAELEEAVHVTERTNRAVTFTVTDRDDDGSPERLRYAWSGAAGDGLTRQYNDESEVEILGDVHHFELSYDVATTTEEYPGAPVEGDETLLSVYDGSEDLKSYSIDANKWIGQYFQPDPPEDAVTWSVTRVLFQAKKRGASDGKTAVQLRQADGDGLPTGGVLEQHLLYESDLTDSYTWREFTFEHVSGLMPDDALCLILAFVSADVHSARIRYESDEGPGRLATSDGGANWNYDSGKKMRYYVYGRYTYPAPEQTATRDYVTGVRVSLQAGDDPAARVNTAVRTVNAPELLSAVWELDFNSDPTALDANADGQGDWVVRDGSAFDAASLDAGVWQANATLDTFPENDFNELTTVEVRFRATSVGGTGAVFWINADWTGSNAVPLYAALQLQPNGSQTLTVYRKVSNGTLIRLATVVGLSADFVTLRLLIDPDLDTVNIRVNGRQYSTHAYATWPTGNDDRFASILPWDCDAQFDYVSVRVGGND